MIRALRAAFACALISLAITGTARASGGNYVFDGGTPDQQAQVQAALDASSFPWSVVPQQIDIRIAPGLPSEATPGVIWLDSSLVDTGEFSWGVIQHEYAHQVDFLMLSDAARAALTSVLGGRTWCWGSGADLQHSQLGCERFASTLAWSFWPSDSNSLRPMSAKDESAALPPAQFKALLGALLKERSADDQVATIRQFLGRATAASNAGAAKVTAAAPATAAVTADQVSRRVTARTKRPSVNPAAAAVRAPAHTA